MTTVRQYPLASLLVDLAASQKDANRRYCFVLGSGASKSSGIPTGSELTDVWLQHIYAKSAGTTANAPLEELKAWATEQQLRLPGFTWENRATFYGYLFKQAFEQDPKLGQDILKHYMENKVPSFGYSVLARIVAYTRNSIVITTNFDHLVEEALRRFASTDFMLVHTEQTALQAKLSLSQRGPAVMKIHGDIFFETYNAFDDIDRLRPGWKQILRRVMSEFTPIFIGYGGHDPGFMSFLHSLEKGTTPCGPLWFYRTRPPASPPVSAFLNKQDGYYVNAQGFDQLMILIGAAFDVSKLERDHAKEKERNEAAWMRQFEDVVDEVLPPYRAQRTRYALPESDYERLFRNSVCKLLETAGGERWWEWHCLARIARTRREATTRYKKGMHSLPESLPLEACFAGHLAQELRQPREALERIQGALESAIARYGDTHPDTVAVRHKYARILEFIDTPETRVAAAHEFKTVFISREKTLGSKHPDTLASLGNLARYLLTTGCYSDGYDRLAELLRRRIDVNGSGHPTVASLERELAEVEERHRPLLCIHQPHFLPWLGYVNKIANSSHCVILDNVQFRDYYFQHRTKLLNNMGETRWFSLPILGSRNHRPMSEITVDSRWRSNLLAHLENGYRKAPFYPAVLADITKAITDIPDRLVDINFTLIKWVTNYLGFPDVQFHLASQITGETDRTERLIKIATAVKVKRILMGEGGSAKCHDVQRLQTAGLEPVYQKFRDHYPSYPRWQPQFDPEISVLDILMQCGSFQARKLISQAWNQASSLSLEAPAHA